MKGYCELIETFIYEVHMMHYPNKGEYYYKVYKIFNKISYYYTVTTTTVLVVSGAMFNLGPVYSNAQNLVFNKDKAENYTLQFSVYFSFPGFDPNEHFKLVTLYNFYVSANCAILIVGIDLILYLMIFQIIGHVYVLRHNLSQFGEPQKQKSFKVTGISNKGANLCLYQVFMKEENERAHSRLCEAIEHHKLIIRFTDDISQVFGPVLAFNYSFHLVGCCLLLLECSQGDTDSLFRFGPLTLVIFTQLIQMSVIFEVLGSETEKLKDTAYLVPWEYMDTRNQRTVCFLLQRMQEKVSLKALGLTAVGVNTMIKILKTTMSYFALLRSFD